MRTSEWRDTTLVVDLDGTLTPTDTLVESALILLRRNPLLNGLRLLFWLLSGRSGFKQKIAEQLQFSAQHLPLREDLLAWLTTERSQGRRIVLATAAHQSIADSMAQRLGLFDQVLASSAALNLKGSAKLAAIRQHHGDHFVYAGDSAADLPIWRAAKAAVLVDVSPRVARRLGSQVPIEREFRYAAPSWRLWMRALRVHQWVKNLLLFVPLFTAFSFGEGQKLMTAFAGFIAFSMAASGTYLMNDLWDLDSDRQHPRKKGRALAAAQIPLLHGGLAAALLMLAALGLAWVTAPPFAAMLLGYIVLTTAYSWSLKHYVLIDVLMLALLYTYRVLAGSVATDITVTPWLLAFSVFTFLSLALVKRCAELVSLQKSGKQGASGRDYQIGDLVVLWPLGIGASLCSVLVFGLYIGTPGAESHYGNAEVLWLVGVGLLYWFARLWIKTARGEMHDDPIVFALRDFGSRISILAIVALTVTAHFLN